MNKPRTVPSIVSKRNQFRPAEEFVEDALPYFPEQLRNPALKGWLLRYTEGVIRGVADHFSVAASRGIEQAAQLLCDPEFYATARERRAKQRRQWQEQLAKQEWDRIEQSNCPTAEQIEKQIQYTERQIIYNREQLAAHEKNLERLRSIVPKNIRLVPSKSVQ
jgi:hypothetical protein